MPKKAAKKATKRSPRVVTTPVMPIDPSWTKIAEPASETPAIVETVVRSRGSIFGSMFVPILLIVLAFTGKALYDNWQLRQDPAEVSVSFLAKVKTFAATAEGYASVFELASAKIASGEIKNADELSKYATPLNIKAREKAQEHYRIDWNAKIPNSRFEDPQAVAKAIQQQADSWRQLSIELDKLIGKER